MKSFHWRNRVALPLVFDDSLSFYEVLGKLQNALNELYAEIRDNLQTYIAEAISQLLINGFYDEENEAIVLNIKEADGE